MVGLTASDDAGDEFGFGWSVSISENTAIVGGLDTRAAYIFRFNGTNWVEEQKLTAIDVRGADHFAHSVSIHGDIAVIGAPQDDDDGRSSPKPSVV